MRAIVGGSGVLNSSAFLAALGSPGSGMMM
jgi:hypothetical protein